MDPRASIRLIKERLSELEGGSIPPSANSRQFHEWREQSLATLRLIFGERSEQLGRFASIIWAPMHTPWSDAAGTFEESRGRARAMMKGFIFEIEQSQASEPRVPAPSEWIHPRLLDHVKDELARAQASGNVKDWAKVSRESIVLLETELRKRSGSPAKGRKDLAADCFAVETGSLRLGDDSAAQEAWKLFVMGLLTGAGNPVLHEAGAHQASYAMGVVGTVSMVLTAIDEAYGSAEA